MAKIIITGLIFIHFLTQGQNVLITNNNMQLRILDSILVLKQNEDILKVNIQIKSNYYKIDSNYSLNGNVCLCNFGKLVEQGYAIDTMLENVDNCNEFFYYIESCDDSSIINPLLPPLDGSFDPRNIIYDTANKVIRYTTKYVKPDMETKILMLNINDSITNLRVYPLLTYAKSQLKKGIYMFYIIYCQRSFCFLYDPDLAPFKRYYQDLQLQKCDYLLKGRLVSNKVKLIVE